jgi:hypothetical protein
MSVTPQPPTKPSERVWEVDCFVVDHAQGIVLPDPVAVRESMFEVQAILTRLGGVVQIGSKRDENYPSPGQVSTTKLLFRWQSFAPISPPEDAAVPPAPPEAEPAAVPSTNGDGPAAAVEEQEPAQG